MSLYIHAENQAILWQILQTVPALQTFQCPDKPAWFRSIVSKFYEANQFKSFSSAELQQMNRDTIAYMVRELNQATASTNTASTTANTTGTPTVTEVALEPMHHTENLHSYSFTNSFLPGTSAFESTDVAIHDNGATIPKMGVHPKTVTRNYLSQQKQSAVNERFAQRQQEYDTMIKGVAPKPIDFRQPMTAEDDGILENISDLVQKYRQERDLLSEPPPALPAATALPPVQPRPAKTVAQIDKPMIRHSIHRSTVAEPLVNELVDVTDLDLMEISTHKNVRWSETLEETEPFTEDTHEESVASAVEPFSIQVQALRQELKQFMDEMKRILGSSPVITNGIAEGSALTGAVEGYALTEVDTLAESKHRDQVVQHESIEC
jgi:hypothetical protein